MDRKCDKCGKTVEGLVRAIGPKDYPKQWCFACIYEKGLADYNERNIQ